MGKNIVKEARRRAWLKTRGALYIAVSGVLGTAVAIILAILCYR